MRRRRRRQRLPFTPTLGRLLTGAALVAGLLVHVSPARAGDEAAAEALFAEAKRLAAQGKLAEACPKFAESNRLDRGAGTLIHLADCYEKNHQSASAWATFKDAASAAQAINRPEWQKLATQRAAALEPRLAKLTINVVAPADKIEVTRDGAPTSPASWGIPIPVDTGTHTVAAGAPGRKPFTTTVTVAKDGDRPEVVVPALEATPAAAVAAAAAPPPRAAPEEHAPHHDEGAGQRTAGFVVGGIGVAGLAAGAITGLIAIHKNKDSKDACPDDGACGSRDAVDANDSAKTFGVVSTIAFIAGAAGVVGGAILVLTAPRDASSSRAGLRVVPATDGRSANLSVLGVF
ncbi:MAG: hypothetical protein JWP97_1630 [Labilithrix sp.]|nr:hypothetical protein [Labilithrix sp.]